MTTAQIENCLGEFITRHVLRDVSKLFDELTMSPILPVELEKAIDYKRLHQECLDSSLFLDHLHDDVWELEETTNRIYIPGSGFRTLHRETFEYYTSGQQKAIREYCQAVDPQRKLPAYYYQSHYSVSNCLASYLKEFGETVVDFYGLNVWPRRDLTLIQDLLTCRVLIDIFDTYRCDWQEKTYQETQS